ncbi:phosphoenolpyruvate carboxykinase (ATP) [Lacibacter sp. H407]|uniref:phosphoenolpyruvate carboxykinase (ATP) n=1 Tax=Lacibacter sp. H407 TaxID=3133423 RepID=UPI0030C36704
MSIPSVFFPEQKLIKLGLKLSANIHYQLSADELCEQTINRRQGVYNNSGALCINTGEFTGRSPKDKFIVLDNITKDTVHWNDFNQPIDERYFHMLYKKMMDYLGTKEEIWVRDAYACAEPAYRLNIRVVNENPWSNLFAHNLFLRPTEDELDTFEPDWHIIQAPGFFATPETDGVRSKNFALVSFTNKIILIGGSGYTGEMKKGIFTVLNYLLPQQKNVLSMHCSANMGTEGDVAVFFGLSGTGKTTLSADPNRKLIGDDEHGWDEDSIFNFEGGCYAKCIDLTAEKEPEIFNAIRHGALVENIRFFEGTNEIDFSNKAITENTRVSYPLHYISNALQPAVGGLPKNIFFLTCDATGVLPPIAKLTEGQTMYQFISGYTAKVAGTEAGVTEPKSTFSACFGAPFLPLHPAKYAEMLGWKMNENKVNVWLVNTGWTGGCYGIGKRIKLSYTRALISAALNGELNDVQYENMPVFNLAIPTTCTAVPDELLNPRNTWTDKAAYDEKAKSLAEQFITNFKKYASGSGEEILAAAPQV